MEEELQQAQEIYNLIVNYLVTYSFQILAAIIIMLLGNLVAKKVSAFLEGFMVNKGLDITLSRFAASFVKIVIIAFAAITALDMLDISVTPFVAAVGALSLGAGLALQGLLSNYGAGVSIIVARPFVVGDTIKVQGVTGVVKEVKLAYTILSNEDEVEITIPNRHIVGEIIHNSQENSIIESTVGIAYASDTERAIAVILRAVTSTEGVSAAKPPQIGIDNFGDSSIDIGMRYWVPTDKLFATKYRVNQAVFKALEENGIEIPFPQRDVHLLSAEAPVQKV
jgi:small conductance mechanosensitive channel